MKTLSVRNSRKKIHHDKRSELAGSSVKIKLRIHLDDVDRFRFMTNSGEAGGFQYVVGRQSGRVGRAYAGRLAPPD